MCYQFGLLKIYDKNWLILVLELNTLGFCRGIRSRSLLLGSSLQINWVGNEIEIRNERMNEIDGK